MNLKKVKMSKYQICKRCVIDNASYVNTKFNSHGICSYCLNFDKNIKPKLFQNIKNKNFAIKLKQKLNLSKKFYKSDYDCLIGVSGGVDSSYLVYHAVTDLNLKPLLYHVDTGWNNSIAVSNIEKIIDKFGLDLHTDVIDWNEMKDLCRSFLKSQVPYMESIQDHAIWAGMHKYAKENNIKHILTGGNLQTENIRAPLNIAYYAGDLTLMKDIHNKFGDISLNKFPTLDILKYKIYYKYIYKIKLHQPLNYINYKKNVAITTLQNKIDWKSYGGKHHESNFTKFFDGYWKPKKFNHDNRRGHLSSLIVTKQISRDEAISELKKNSFDEISLNRDLQYISSKLDFDLKELKILFDGKNKYYYDYRSKHKILNFITTIIKFLKINIKQI